MVRTIVCLILLSLVSCISEDKYKYSSNIVKTSVFNNGCSNFDSQIKMLDSISFDISQERRKMDTSICADDLSNWFWAKYGFGRDLYLLGKLNSDNIFVFCFEEKISDSLSNVNGYIAVANKAKNRFSILEIFNKGIDQSTSLDFKYLNGYILLIQRTDNKYDIENEDKSFKVTNNYCILKKENDGFSLLNQNECKSVLKTIFKDSRSFEKTL